GEKHPHGRGEAKTLIDKWKAD
ncbi:hypothetical protein BMETH_29612771344679, partial [methanotrophic bacterial endosymbiont of Bathymodiolus sp.]